MDTILDTVAPARRAGRRPNFPLNFKRQVVEATFQPGASVSLIVREHDVNANLVFRGRRGDRIKLLWWDGHRLCLFCKRLEQGRFVWPQATSGSVSLTTAQLSMLLEGIDWRRPIRTAPVLAV